jgi:hypothetical protein
MAGARPLLPPTQRPFQVQAGTEDSDIDGLAVCRARRVEKFSAFVTAAFRA